MRRIHKQFVQKKRTSTTLNTKDYMQKEMGVMFGQIEDEYVQIPAYPGIQKVGKEAVAAMIKEFYCNLCRNTP